MVLKNINFLKMSSASGVSYLIILFVSNDIWLFAHKFVWSKEFYTLLGLDGLF
jgi:hypothetical protein